MQNKRLRLDYKETESGLFSAAESTWGIFIFVRIRAQIVRERT